VETILSGPAASMIGASWLTGLNDAMIADMGGTTTDIGILSGAMPSISENGAIIGGWQTRIRSIEIWTVGLGGDSSISISAEGGMQIGPRRAEPLSHACFKYPDLKRKIEQLSATEEMQQKELDLNYFVLAKQPNFQVERREQQILNALDGKPLHLTEIEQLTGPWFDVRRFANLGFVSEISFTPTDLLHCMGALSLWDTSICESILAFYSRKTGLNPDTLLQRLFDEIVQKLKQTLVAAALAYEKIPLRSQEASALLADILRLGGDASISAQFQLAKPLIAVGAPVSAYFPDVAAQLGVRMVIPENADVANAAGAVTGRVIASAQLFIRPVRPIGFVVIPDDEEKIFDSLSKARIHAEQRVRLLAHERAQENGAKNISVTVNTEELAVPLARSWGNTLLMEIKINAVAIGEPCL
jgi:N-methylhydantoinase A/oxoprolinase/acetone carboxylase beta subunit